MSLLSWLLALGTRRDIAHADRAIAEKSETIRQMDKGIEAAQPIVEEAIRRTDDAYYTLRSKVKTAERRRDRAASDLFMRDLEKGWRTRDG